MPGYDSGAHELHAPSSYLFPHSVYIYIYTYIQIYIYTYIYVPLTTSGSNHKAWLLLTSYFSLGKGNQMMLALDKDPEWHWAVAEM